MHSTCPEIEIEEGPYPTDHWLEEFTAWKPVSLMDASLFFTKDLPEIFEEHLHPFGYSKSVEDKNGKRHVYLATGGWSGCESVLGALESGECRIYQWMFWRMSSCGGARWYEVPALREVV